MPEKHAKLSPSSSKKWLNCPLSIEMESHFPNAPGVAAQEGTTAHTLGEYKIRLELGEITRAQYHKQIQHLEIDSDMESYTDDYRDFVIERLNEAKSKTPDAQLFLEQEMDFSKWAPEGYGTADAVILWNGGVEVIDFKYGRILVDAPENTQLRLYSLGAIEAFGFIYNIQEVITSIFQPRIHNISSAVEDAEALLLWAEEYVKPRAKAAYLGEGECTPGNHCEDGYCRALAVCKAHGDYRLRMAEKAFQNPRLLTVDEIADVLEQSERLAKWAKLVADYALDQVMNHGVKYPGYKAVEGRSNRTYSLPEGDIASVLLEKGYKEDAIYKRTIKGITDMETMLGKQAFSEILGSYVIKPPGKPTLVPVSDKRPEMATLEAAKADFANIIGN